MDVKTLSAMLGHVSAATTLDIYTHITDDMQRAAAENIDRGIGKVAPQEDASEPGQETAPAQVEKPSMTDFKPYAGRKRQAEGIAAAKAKGVKFGRPPIPLPDNFYPVHKAWRAKKMTLKQAAATCGMPVGTFYSKAVRFENTT